MLNPKGLRPPSFQLCFIKSHSDSGICMHMQRDTETGTHIHMYFFIHLYSSDTSVCCLILPCAFLRLSLCPFSFQSINSNIRPATSRVSFYKVPISSVCSFPFTEMSPLPFPAHAKVYSYASYYPHTVPSLVFSLYKRSVLSTYVIILPQAQSD